MQLGEALAKREAEASGWAAPIVGRISMDYTTIDVTDIPGVSVGDAATFLGRDGDQCLPVEELARRAGTIPYEITCSIGKRVARLFRARTKSHAAAIRPEPQATPVQTE